MAQIIEQNTENHIEETSAPSLSMAAGHDVSAPEMSGESPLPSLAGKDETPVHLATLADRARGYVAAASSANTRKAYATDPSSKHPAIITVLPAEAGERPDCCRSGLTVRIARARSIRALLSRNL